MMQYKSLRLGLPPKPSSAVTMFSFPICTTSSRLRIRPGRSLAASLSFTFLTTSCEERKVSMRCWASCYELRNAAKLPHLPAGRFHHVSSGRIVVSSRSAWPADRTGSFAEVPFVRISHWLDRTPQRVVGPSSSPSPRRCRFDCLAYSIVPSFPRTRRPNPVPSPRLAPPRSSYSHRSYAATHLIHGLLAIIHNPHQTRTIINDLQQRRQERRIGKHHPDRRFRERVLESFGAERGVCRGERVTHSCEGVAE